MSRVNKVVVKPCCKVCKDAGKSAQEYGSHWPKDKDGATVCPTLLSQECRYCHQAGHTVKYCKALEKDNALRAKRERLVERVQKHVELEQARTKASKPTASPAPATGRFALLMGDDDDSDESPRSPKRTQKKAPKEEFPTLSRKVFSSSPITESSWIQAVTVGGAASSARVVVEKSGLCEYPHKTKELSAREKAAAVHRHECFKGLNGKGWADLDESDDEEEEMVAEDAW